MKRLVIVAAIVLTVSAGTARAKYPHYGSTGIQFGCYKYPPPGNAYVGASVSGYSPGYSYAAPNYGYGVPNYGYGTTQYAPSGGCFGSGFGYGQSGYGLVPGAGAGYGFGYGGSQAGVFPFPGFGGGGAGGILETIRVIKEITKELDGGFKTDSATKEEIQKLRDDVAKLRTDIGSISKEEVQKLRDEVRNLRSDLSVLKVPGALDDRLAELKVEQQKTNLEVQKLAKEIELLKKK